jgi:hypothetical protein
LQKIFLTFADTSLKPTLERIKAQAFAMGVYDKVFAINENHLSDDFKIKYQEKLNKKVRGFGYWVWKPQIIKQLLEKINYGDIINYCDAGCHLNQSGRDRLIEYFEIVNNTDFGILCFQLNPPKFGILADLPVTLDYPDFKWIKADLLNYLKIPHDSVHLKSQTIGAGIIFIKKTLSTERFINEWLKVFDDDFSLVDDSESKLNNIDGFIEHRHDQAIFSMLCKKNNVSIESAYEYWYPNNDGTSPNWDILKFYPFHVRRDKVEISRNLISSFFKKINILRS